MSVKNFSLALQNGIVYHCGYVENSTLYNDVVQNGSSSGVVKTYGTLSDIKSIIGDDPFNVPINVSRASNTQWHSAQELFFNAFRHVYESNGTGSGDPPGWVLTTNGLFNARVDKITNNNLGAAYSSGPNYDYHSAGYTGAPMRTYAAYYAQNQFTNTAEPIFYVNVLNNSDYLNCIRCTISIQYSNRDNTNIWTVKYYKESGTYLDYINNNFSNPYKDVILNYFNNLEPDFDNPYGGGGYSGTGGGATHKQNWSEHSDEVTLDPMPDQSKYGAVACGLVTIFHPTKDQVKKLADVMWGQGFLNFLQNLVENISDLFISFGMIPFSVTHGRSVEVTWFSFDVGGEVPIGTGIFLDLANEQWLEFDMGSISLTGNDDRIFANDTVLDYSPYSKLGIYLPFIGYQELDIDECRNAVLTLTYRIDLLSGTAVAIITSSSFDKDRALYQFTGNCLTQIPLTSMDAGTMITNAVNIGLAAASAGATEAVASAGDAMTAENLASGKITASAAEFQNAQRSAQVSNSEGSLVGATVNGVMGMKPNFKHSGGISAAASLFAVKQPYLFLTTPRQSYPDGYGRVCGFPSNIGGVLGGFPGYTVVEDIRLNNLVATSSEVEEIYQLLKSGVIV